MKTLTMRASLADATTSMPAARLPAIAFRSMLRLLNSGVRANGAPHFPSIMVPLLIRLAGIASQRRPLCVIEIRQQPARRR
jgi:hypothetical protein